jgi:hypothetical protein
LKGDIGIGIHGEVYLIQHYVIKFVSDLRQVCGFLQILWFPLPIKLTATIILNITEILLKVELNIITHNPNPLFADTDLERIWFSLTGGKC